MYKLVKTNNNKYIILNTFYPIIFKKDNKYYTSFNTLKEIEKREFEGVNMNRVVASFEKIYVDYTLDSILKYIHRLQN